MKVFDEVNPEAQRKEEHYQLLNALQCYLLWTNDLDLFRSELKLGMFGVVHVCALDGFSCKIVGNATMA